MKFQGVAEEILEKAAYLIGVGLKGREVSQSHPASGLLQPGFQKGRSENREKL
jgi:hypothetical protein